MTQVGYSTQPQGATHARRVEKYDPSIGCLAIHSADGWCVVCPSGVILRRFRPGDYQWPEYEARNYAMFLNLTNDVKLAYRHGVDRSLR